jgi:23S rRNA (guanosine2251-2'-O)-methyltransferase
VAQIIYGLHAVQSVLKHHADTIDVLYFDAKRQDQRLQQLLELAQSQEVECIACNKDELNKKSGSEQHQGVVVEAEEKQQHQSLEELLDTLQEPPLLLVLDGVTDPHNLGACLRTADAAGVHAVIFPKDKSASINATVRKVACGAAEVMPVYPVTNLARCLEQLQQRGIWIIGTAGEAEKTLYELELQGPMALVMGAEGKGMRRLTRDHCDYLAKLPMAGSVSSLNVSVATGVCLFEMVRQRQLAAKS